jgi:hypothetical protein
VVNRTANRGPRQSVTAKGVTCDPIGSRTGVVIGW